MPIIITHSRKELVRRQKACIDYVHKRNNPTDARSQEAVQDFQRWSKDSGIFKNKDRDSKGMKWITSYERKESVKERPLEYDL